MTFSNLPNLAKAQHFWRAPMGQHSRVPLECRACCALGFDAFWNKKAVNGLPIQETGNRQGQMESGGGQVGNGNSRRRNLGFWCVLCSHFSLFKKRQMTQCSPVSVMMGSLETICKNNASSFQKAVCQLSPGIRNPKNFGVHWLRVL